MIARDEIVLAARARLGLRWQHQARADFLACDCFGLVLLVALAVGVPNAQAAADDPDLKAYGRDPDYGRSLAAFRRYMTEIPKADAQAGDVLYMHVHRGIHPQHCAIKSADDPPYMIHAWATSRGVVENRIDEVWDARIVHVFRFQGVA